MEHNDSNIHNGSDGIYYTQTNDAERLVGPSYLADGTLSPSEIDAVFEALANQRRRRAIRILDDIGVVDIGTISDRLTDIELPEVDADKRTVRKRIYPALYQTHIPTLDDCGIVTWAGNSEHAIATGPLFDVAVAVLDRADEPVESEDTGLLERLRAVVGGDS